MLEESTGHSGELINAAEQAISEYFQTTIHVSKVIQLSEPDRRNLILRLLINQAATGIPGSIILKKTAVEKQIFEKGEQETEAEQLSRFAHDWAGLQFLTQLNSRCAPFFYAGNLEHKFILIEDLGVEHHSLVDPLIRTNSPANQQEAELALLSYMRNLGKLHAETAMKSQLFSSILQRIYPASNRLHFPDSEIPSVIKRFNILSNDKLNELKEEIEGLVTFLLAPSEFNVLLHGDICPDNVYFQNNEIKFIDFEFGDFGNALIDGVYLRMSMPSCWCSKALPENIIKQMETVYRDELKIGIPAAADDKIYTKQLIYACAYWAIRTINQIDDMNLLDHEWVCPSGPIKEDSKWEADRNTFRPRILSRLKTFIDTARGSDYLPLLCQVSESLLTELIKTWPETHFIDYFPVYK
jgi:thiamine kinase-like enzyme